MTPQPYETLGHGTLVDLCREKDGIISQFVAAYGTKGVSLKYEFPPIGTILPPAVNVFPPAAANDQDGVNRFKQGAAQERALDLNNQLKTKYLQEFNDVWLVQYTTGRMAWDAVPPALPMSYMVVVVIPPDSDGSVGFDFQQIGPPVCDPPSFTRLPKPQH